MRQQKTISDTHAVRGVLAGRREDFAVLVRRYLPAMVALAHSTTGSYADAEDIAQESFLHAFRHLDRLKDPARFGAWMASIVKNAARTFTAQRAKRAQALAATPRQATGRPSPETREIHAFLRKEIGRLDETFRDVLLLHYFAGMTAREIADVLNISRNAVLKRLERGRHALGQQLVEVLGQGLTPDKQRLTQRATRTMAIVAAAPIAWKPSTAAAAAAGTVGAGTLLQTLRTASRGLKACIAVGASAVVASLGVVVGGGLLATTPTEAKTSTPVVEEQPLLVAAAAETEPLPVAPVEANEQDAATEPTPPALVEPERTDPALPARLGALPGYPGPVVQECVTDVVIGTVYDPLGKPLPGAMVWVARAGQGARDNRETVTDDAGRFELTVPEGQWTVRAAKGTFGGEADTDPRGEFIAEGRRQEVRTSVRTENRSLLRGQLLDEATGDPIPNGQLWTDTNKLITADAEGRFIIEGLRQRDHTLVAICPGYVRKCVICSTVLRREAMLEVPLERGGRVSGVITDTQGRPVAHAWIRMEKSGGGCQDGYFEVCDKQGRFEYDGVPLDRTFYLEAQWPCYVNTCSGPPYGRKEWRGAIPSGSTGLSLTLAMPEGPEEEIRRCDGFPYREGDTVIRGRVLDPEGQPVRDFHIRLRLSRPLFAGQGGVEVNYGYPGVLFTSDDGTFALTSMHNELGDVVDVVAMVDGYREARHERATFKATATSCGSDDITLRLSPMASLDVRVVDAHTPSMPIAGVKVTLSDPFWNMEGQVVKLDSLGYRGDRPQDAVTDANGIARFVAVTCPDGLVTIEKDGAAMKWARWDGKAPSVALALEQGGTVEGVVLGEDGGRLVYADSDYAHPMLTLKGSLDGSYDVNDPNDVYREYGRLELDDMHFRIDNLPPRYYELTVGWAVEEGDIIVHKNYTDTLILEPGQVLHREYPRDDAGRNPGRLLEAAAQVASAADEALQAQLVGAWTYCQDLPDGSTMLQVNYFGPDGEWWRTEFRTAIPFTLLSGERGQIPPSAVTRIGWFTVTGGKVSLYDEANGMHTWFPGVEINGDTLVVLEPDLRPSRMRMTRAASAEAALCLGEETCGVSRDAGMPDVEQYGGTRVGQGGYGMAN